MADLPLWCVRVRVRARLRACSHFFVLTACASLSTLATLAQHATGLHRRLRGNKAFLNSIKESDEETDDVRCFFCVFLRVVSANVQSSQRLSLFLPQVSMKKPDELLLRFASKRSGRTVSNLTTALQDGSVYDC